MVFEYSILLRLKQPRVLFQIISFARDRTHLHLRRYEQVRVATWMRAFWNSNQKGAFPLSIQLNATSETRNSIRSVDSTSEYFVFPCSENFVRIEIRWNRGLREFRSCTSTVATGGAFGSPHRAARTWSICVASTSTTTEELRIFTVIVLRWRRNMHLFNGTKTFRDRRIN
jgi:hypothetical protein